MSEPIRIGGSSGSCRHCMGPAVDVCDCPCHRPRADGFDRKKWGKAPCKPLVIKGAE